MDSRLKCTPRPPSRAFTLIELLVVISIIALLVGILLPALSAARDSARNAQCLSNVKGIGTAISVYLEDFRQTYPAGKTDNTNAPGDLYWVNLVGKAGTGPTSRQVATEDRILNSYLANDTRVARCPLDKGTYQNASVASAFDYHGTSYWYGNRTPAQFADGNFYTFAGIWLIEGHRASEVQMGSRKVIVMGEPAVGSLTTPNSKLYWHNSASPLQFSAVFADGHASTMTQKTNTVASPLNASALSTMSITDAYY